MDDITLAGYFVRSESRLQVILETLSQQNTLLIALARALATMATTQETLMRELHRDNTELESIARHIAEMTAEILRRQPTR